MAPRKIIIDTDPGVDDVLAILLALSALPEELEVLLISITYGNIDLRNCLRNVVSLFYHVEKEISWRESRGRRPGFETLQKSKPLVAIGAEHPLADQILMADYFHGEDGLGGIHSSHPHLSPADTWKQLFAEAQNSNDPPSAAIAEELRKTDTLFIPSRQPSYQEILRILGENEPETVTIVAIGPLTNVAIAAATDPETFLRVKELVVMGGNIDESGNVGSFPSSDVAQVPEPPFRLIKQAPGPLRDLLSKRNQITPVAEFNTFADSVAAARVYALSSPNPHSTMPPASPAQHVSSSSTEPPLELLGPYPDNLSRQLKVVLFPLDITNRHQLTRGLFNKVVSPLNAEKSPLAEWISAFLGVTFNKIESLKNNVSGDAVGLELHDPLCIWYCMISELSGWTFTENEDIRVETTGQWTRGMCIVDRRPRKMREPFDEGERAGDTGNWLSLTAGNRLARCVGSPSESDFGEQLLSRILGSM